jgi:NADPH2:quinone reductase
MVHLIRVESGNSFENGADKVFLYSEDWKSVLATVPTGDVVYDSVGST